ncbi:MAG: hypothetical protein ACI9S8_002934 [Chlamydiales bacterium]|jgi:hypothetical protein
MNWAWVLRGDIDRLPGEAWLEFEMIVNENGKRDVIRQKVTFRPNGLLGCLYGYSINPFHCFVFVGLSRYIIQDTERDK